MNGVSSNKVTTTPLGMRTAGNIVPSTYTSCTVLSMNGVLNNKVTTTPLGMRTAGNIVPSTIYIIGLLF